MSSAVEVVDRMPIERPRDVNVQNDCTEEALKEFNTSDDTYINGDCAICLKEIALPQTALVKGCEHAYCVTCILQWASYQKNPTCPQCKTPFEFLNIHRRALDGSIRDYMIEESVSLLLRASWFDPPIVVERADVDEEIDYYYNYYYFEDEEEEDIDDDYFGRSSSSIHIGNRRWGGNGYIRGGRQEARPVYRANFQGLSTGSSNQPRKKDSAMKETVGRRAKRALKREAAAKHQQLLVRPGR